MNPQNSGRKLTPLSECPDGGWTLGNNIEDKICFTNICEINSNINAAHHYLQSNHKNFRAPINHLSFSNYKNGGIVAFDILRLRLNSKTSPKFICCLYRSPSDHDLLEYLAVKIDFLNINHPASEVVLLGDFNDHNLLCRAVEAFALTQGLTQLVTGSTFFPRVSSHASSLLDLFLATHPVPYSTAILSPLAEDKAHRTFSQNPTPRNKYNEASKNFSHSSLPPLTMPLIQRAPYTMREVTFRQKTVRRVLLSLDINKASALLSVISKEMESLISDRQYGFRHQRSTLDLLAYVTQLWSKLIQSDGGAHVVALDITKAFDQLWVADFISGRKISVVVDGFSSSSHNVNTGVPQGSVLAPTLFLLHINDLLSCTINRIHRFADDSTLHAGIQSDKLISAAELEKRRLATTSSLTRDLEFNASKTQYCTLTNKKRPSAHPVSMDGRVLPKSHSFRQVGRQNDLTLYKVQIRPSLEYFSHVWGAAAATTLFMLDAVQRRAVRLIDDSSLTDNPREAFPSSTNLRQFKNRVNKISLGSS
ncbi:unnamed protein product [Acanthoscelides obtectus]|uniref:Reverse transcriptase domain-containing protein n=1 Tax=Acanthoscelides obtectus TaxID=200917 RepID=A0A9P0NZL1_ACAOB|nr:unnamed protein product [Acanthoscelides obtectus]CAK1627536.1 RNA-directed DNA polymerase from mobile element jockey [Acanthoscelides obtectus]